MTSVILQPSANKDARQHYVDTIANPVRINDHYDMIPTDQFQELAGIFLNGRVPMWGVTPGKGAINVSKWNKATVGDVVLFAAHSVIFASGTVALKFHNRPLAERLWGTDAKGQTWEYMYALDEIRSLDISYLDFNRAVGYKDNNVIQGFTVMNEERSTAALDRFGLWSKRHDFEVSEQELDDALSGLDGPLDTKVQSWTRTEQSKARRLLLKNRMSSECRLCERTYPREFLVAAHKKKRSECSPDEKRDLRNVVMLCCLFGCDVLYEKGLIAVDEDGSIKRSIDLGHGEAATYAQAHIKQSLQISPEEAPYFAWHMEHTFKS